MQKRVIGISSLLLTLVIMIVLGSIYFGKKKDVQIPENSCLVQYNTCAFIEMKTESWEKGCSPIFKQFVVKKVGEKKVLVNETQTKEEFVFPKNLVKEEIGDDDAISNSLFLYLKKCEDKTEPKTTVKNEEPKVEKKDQEEKKEDDYKDLADKCIILKNDCEHIERWEEDKYCHPIKKSFKILEVGNKSFRVVVWNGHGEVANGKLINVGTEYSLSKDEFKSGYQLSDCSELLSKYHKNFNPLKGK